MRFCTVSVVVGVDAELDEARVDDVCQTEDRIVSQWREVSADEKHELRDRIDEILRPLGLQTRLVVVERANSLALCFICMTLAALMSLRDQWRRRQHRDIVESLFTFLSSSLSQFGESVHVKRLTWPLCDYERCLDFFKSEQGQQNSCLNVCLLMSPNSGRKTCMFCLRAFFFSQLHFSIRDGQSAPCQNYISEILEQPCGQLMMELWFDSDIFPIFPIFFLGGGGLKCEISVEITFEALFPDGATYRKPKINE